MKRVGKGGLFTAMGSRATRLSSSLKAPPVSPRPLPPIHNTLHRPPPRLPPQRVHNAMLALRKVVKRFEYKPKESRGPLHDIMKVTLPLLLNMSLQLLAEDSVEAGQVC